MFKTYSGLFTLMIIVLINGAPPDDNGGWRIVGGSDAQVGASPYQVILRIGGSFGCSGSIISKKTILTAAHCVKGLDVSRLTITVGTNLLNSGGIVYEAERYIYHEGHDWWDFTNDVAVIILKNEIEFSDLVSPIALGTEEIGGSVPVTLTGWGMTTPGGVPAEKLQTINLRSISHDDCKHMWDDFIPVFPTQICTLTQRGEGACQGDSGSPLVANNKVIGVVSFGYPCARGMPDVYSRVSSFIGWIEKNAVL